MMVIMMTELCSKILLMFVVALPTIIYRVLLLGGVRHVQQIWPDLQ